MSNGRNLSWNTIGVVKKGFKIGQWNAPDELLDFYQSVNIFKFFKWQIDCLSTPGVLDGKSLIFSAPTSAGKTLVAEILMWKRLSEKKCKALYVVPFVSVGREKVIYLQNLFKTIGLKCDAYIGNQNALGGIHSWDVAVCTIEKANSLVNRCIEENTLEKIGVVVIDEFHIISDHQRGYLIELLLTKILNYSHQRFDIQIIGMSATVSNLSALCRWLNAAEYSTNFRPIELSETYFCQGRFYDRSSTTVRRLAEEYFLDGDQDNVVGLCIETILDGCGTLIFCPTKNWCEKLSITVATAFEKYIRHCPNDSLSIRLKTELNPCSERTVNFINEYKRIVGFVDPVLSKTLPFGVAFHHAGLTVEERDQLERAFRYRNIRVLIATSTLSSGVNLPARRVIIRSPWGQTGSTGPKLTHASYKQMIGRAGRQGLDAQGESIIMCKPHEVKRAVELMNGNLENVESAFLRDKNLPMRLKRAVLEAIVGDMISSVYDAVEYVGRTLFATQLVDTEGQLLVEESLKICLQYLSAREFIITEGEKCSPTQLGRATVASAMNPGEAFCMFEDLQLSQRALVLDNELHLVYLVTPTYMQNQWGQDFDWLRYYEIWCRLNEGYRRVADRVGVTEVFIMTASRRCGIRPANADEARKYDIHMRFYTALALLELIEETSLSIVAEKYRCSRGFLQALQQQASTYAGMTVAFCDRLGWNHMKMLLTGFAERIAFGVRRELTELVQIDGLDGSRARVFHYAGFSTLSSLVYASEKDIAGALRKAVPFKSDNGDNCNMLAKRPWLCGHRDMTEQEAVSLIKRRAQTILEENLCRFGVTLQNCQRIQQPSPPLTPTATKNGDRSVNIGDCGKAEPPDQICEKDAEKSENHTRQNGNISSKNDSLINVNLENGNDDFDDILMNISRLSITPHTSFKIDGQVPKGEDENVHPPSSLDSLVNGGIFIDKNGSLAKNPLDDSFNQSFLLEATSQKFPDNFCLENRFDACYHPKNSSYCSPQMFTSIDDLPPSLSSEEISKIQVVSDPMISSPDIFAASSNKEPDEDDEIEPEELEEEDSQKCNIFPPLYSDGAKMEKSIGDTQKDIFTPPLHWKLKRRFTRTVLGVDSENGTPSPLLRKCARPNHTTPKNVVSPSTIRSNPAGVLDNVGTDDDFIPSSQKLNDSDKISKNLDERKWLTVVDVCADRVTFEKFATEWRRRKSVSVAIDLSTDYSHGNRHRNHVLGIAISWSNRVVHYMSLSKNGNRGSNCCMFSVPFEKRIQLIKECLVDPEDTIRSENIFFDCRRAQRAFFSLCEYLCLSSPVYCLRIADWLLRCGDEKSPPVSDLGDLFQRYSTDAYLQNEFQNYIHQRLLDNMEKCCMEAAIAWCAWPKIRMELLKSEVMWTAYTSVEIPSALVVANMEFNGVECDIRLRKKLQMDLKNVASHLERKAQNLAGRHLNLASHTDVAKVLFSELKLPADGGDCLNGAHRQRQAQRRQHYSTSKDVLEKLRNLHALPGVISDWRKVDNALTTAVAPLAKYAVEERRIFGTYDWCTATGRIIMHEPSLQIFPRPFEVTNVSAGLLETVNVRNLIVASPGCVLISADYSQLELRILAHLSKDKRLTQILNSDEGDVFQIVASAWLGLPENEITPEQRQRAKKLCYGVIYGMGPKTLATELDVTETTAIGFMDAFKLQFPDVFKWMTEVINSCRENGFVTTLSGRRRYLAAIRNIAATDLRLQAERQAVNTSVQGSAADVFKCALRDVMNALKEHFSGCATSNEGKLYRLVLQLHDELIMEAKATHYKEIADLVRWNMQCCFQLRVRLRVRLSTGTAWGDLKPL